jgi:hypothetical protein
MRGPWAKGKQALHGQAGFSRAVFKPLYPASVKHGDDGRMLLHGSNSGMDVKTQ